MNDSSLLLPIIIPLVAGALCLLIKSRLRILLGAISLLALALNLIVAIKFFNLELTYIMPWVGWGLEFSLRAYGFSNFIVLALAGFAFLIALYSIAFMRNREHISQFFAYFLFSVSFAQGAVLSDNLILLLFFWEGLLLSLFGMIAIGNKGAFKTATKAFIIVGITDLCMMAGVALTGKLAGTFAISQISLPLNTLGSVAFILLMIGAISKGGSMPFHSWIPNAATDAPLPFMALIPGAFEKLLGIYFLTRISLDLFQMQAGSWISVLMMIIGGVTIIFAVMMALVQKDYKRLLSYHAISQVGYMILGVGTAVPAGIIGGLFHMINNALYKSCLFLSGGSVEKQTGTTDLSKLGGIGIKMPVTAICFLITALSISGVWPFNGFFSKELIYDGALERGVIFYLMAVVGSFFTAASFLKLGSAAFLGKLSSENKNTKESPIAMLIPMIIIAAVCVIFGLFNGFAINLFKPVLGERLEAGQHFGAMNIKLVVITAIVLIGALLNHLYGVKKFGSGLKALDHIHYAPILSWIYAKAEKGYFDPYNIGLKFADLISGVALFFDRFVDFIYEKLSVWLAFGFSRLIRNLHTGNYSRYLWWCLLGSAGVIVYLIKT